MRVNIYNEELTDEFKLLHKTADTGESFIGVQFILKSPDSLHFEPGDDDRSSVTFWAKEDEQSLQFLNRLLDEAASSFDMALRTKDDE